MKTIQKNINRLVFVWLWIPLVTASTVLACDLNEKEEICPPAQSSTEDYARDLSQLLGSFDVLEFQFMQKTKDEFGELIDEQQGVGAIAPGNRFFWRSTSPFDSTLIADGEDLYYYDPDLAQVTIRTWSSDPRENPMVVLTGELDVGSYFDVEKLDVGFKLVPRKFLSLEDSNSTLSGRTTNYVERIDLFFNDQLPSGFIVYDYLGQMTMVGLSNVARLKDSINSADDQARGLFEFTIPEGVDVLRDE